GVAGERRPAGPLEAGEHASREPTHDLEALRVDVEQNQLVDLEALGTARDALDELGRVGAAAADDCELDAHSLPPRARAGTSGAIAYNVINSCAGYKSLVSKGRPESRSPAGSAGLRFDVRRSTGGGPQYLRR